MENADRERLREHFLASNEPKKWDELWKNDFTPWDRGLPNPALLDLLLTRKDLVKPVTEDESQANRKLAFVPGCGKGYDVLLFASFGYDAVGLDASPTAIEACRKLAQEEGESYPLQPGVKTRGKITFVYGDFFGGDWEKEVTAGRTNSRFDIIYDYTV
jgi:SAM-dependent methyltransferase